jgi:hypothetical protein
MLVSDRRSTTQRPVSSRLAHLLLLVASGLVIVAIIFGIWGLFKRRWRFLIVSLAFIALYMALVSGACASGFAYYDRLRPTLENDVTQTSASIWPSIRSTYNCTGTNCITALETVMYNNKQRIGIISAVFLLVPSLIIAILMLQMRRDVLYFK